MPANRGQAFGVYRTLTLEHHGPDTPEHYFGQIAAASDAVIRGLVTNKSSQLTPNASFVFTDYEMAVTEVLSNNPVSPVEVGHSIVVTASGGKILLNGVVIIVVDEGFKPLPLDRDLVLFLRYIPETGAYQATGALQIDGSTITPLSSLQEFGPGALRTGRSLMKAEVLLGVLRSVSKR